MRLADERSRLERAEGLGDERRAALAVERSRHLRGNGETRGQRVADLREGEEKVASHVGIGVGAGEDDRRVAERRAVAEEDAAARPEIAPLASAARHAAIRSASIGSSRATMARRSALPSATCPPGTSSAACSASASPRSRSRGTAAGRWRTARVRRRLDRDGRPLPGEGIDPARSAPACRAARSRGACRSAVTSLRVAPSMTAASTSSRPDAAWAWPKRRRTTSPADGVGRAAEIGGNEGIDAVAGRLGVGPALEDQRHGAVPRLLPIGGQERGGRGAMDRLVGEIDRAAERRLDFAAAERPAGETERLDAGQLLRRHGEGRPAEIELRAEPVGRDVRHGADHRGRIERRAADSRAVSMAVSSPARCRAPRAAPPCANGAPSARFPRRSPCRNRRRRSSGRRA